MVCVLILRPVLILKTTHRITEKVNHRALKCMDYGDNCLHVQNNTKCKMLIKLAVDAR